LSGETKSQISSWTTDTLKELLEARIEGQEAALKLAREELERRLDGLNELRKEVTNDRSQFVKVEVYGPAHEDVRRQRNADNEKVIVLTGQVQENSKDIASIKSSLMWLTRLIAGAILLGIIAYIFQRLTGG
jgi:hypothetical protein